MIELQLTNEERLKLELNQTKRQNLDMQIEKLVAEWNAIINEFCVRNSQKIEDATTINLESGRINFKEVNPEKGKEEKKNGRSKA